MTIDQWINLIISFFTFLAAVAAWLSVREMKKQRFTSIKPDFAFDDLNNFYIYRVISVNDFPFLISETELSRRVYSTPGLPSYYLKFYNIGNKGAKSFEATWHFDVDAFVELIRRNNENEVFEIYRRQDFIRISSEEYNFETRDLISRQNSYSRSFIINYELKEKPERLFVPHGYLNLYLSYLFIKYLQDEETEPGTFNFDSIETPPSLKITLNYKDIEEKNHTKEFQVTPKISFLRKLPEEPETGLCFEGDFEIIEQNP